MCLCMCVCVYVCVRMCVCVCMYVCMCVCACMHVHCVDIYVIYFALLRDYYNAATFFSTMIIYVCYIMV